VLGVLIILLGILLPIAGQAAHPLDEICRRVTSATAEDSAKELAADFREKSLQFKIFASFVGEGRQTSDFAEASTEAAEQLLKKRGIQTAPYESTSGKGVQILPGENSPLAAFAKIMEERYQVKVVYVSGKLYRRSATYGTEAKAIFLPHEAVEKNEISEHVLHEALHALFHHRERNGQDSLFLGDFWPKDSKSEGPMWGNGEYPRYMSLEELATYPDTIRRYGDRLRAQLTSGTAKSSEVLQSIETIKNHALQSREILKATHTFFEKALKTAPENIEIKLFEYTTDSGVLTHTFKAVFEADNVKFEMPILNQEHLPAELKTALEAKLTATSGQGRTNMENFHTLARGLALERLRKLEELTSELTRDTDALAKAVDQPPTSVQVLTEIVRASQTANATVTPWIEKKFTYPDFLK